MRADHIALVLHDFSTGGSERIAIRLANDWAAKGRTVSILCGTQQGALRALVDPNVEVETCDPETVRSPWSRLQLGWRLAPLVRKHRPDVVFAPGNFHLIVLAVLARRDFIKRPAFLCKLSNPVGREGRASIFEALVDRITRTIVKPVDALIAMSPSLKKQAQPVFGDKPIAEISEPVLPDQVPVPQKHERTGEGPLILCAGRLCPQKDFTTAIRAFAQIASDPPARLMILGEGPLRVSLVREAGRLGIGDRVILPGHVADIGPYLAEADLFLMTSRYEGYPAVLTEALAAGVRVVTTRCSPAMAEIMDSPELGQVVASRDPKDIAEAISAQLALPEPHASVFFPITARHRIGASAKAYLDLFDEVGG